MTPSAHPRRSAPLIAALKAIFLKSVFFFFFPFKEPFLSSLQGTSERAVDLHDDSDDRLKMLLKENFARVQPLSRQEVFTV